MRTKKTIIQARAKDLKDFISFGLTKTEYQLFFYLLSQTDETNTVRLDKNEVLAIELDTTIRSITRSIIKLENCNLIKKTNHKGGRTFMINPDYFYASKTPFVLLSVYDQL